jgi:hypothetical protein
VIQALVFLLGHAVSAAGHVLKDCAVEFAAAARNLILPMHQAKCFGILDYLARLPSRWAGVSCLFAPISSANDMLF